mmetsp:Transcript_12726/g.20694  ORF Transcript_12726/g.20694 Transcript_12726/m.20694 type:complete len:82 (+) Transcript_12726:2836-3081(+)
MKDLKRLKESPYASINDGKTISAHEMVQISQYKYCKSLLEDLKAETSTASSSTCGMLVDHILLNSSQLSDAVKAVLGGNVS